MNTENNMKYMTVKEVAQDPTFCFTIPMLRYYILHAHKNGLSRAIRRVGRKVLIRKDLLIQWIEKQSKYGQRYEEFSSGLGSQS